MFGDGEIDAGKEDKLYNLIQIYCYIIQKFICVLSICIGYLGVRAWSDAHARHFPNFDCLSRVHTATEKRTERLSVHIRRKNTQMRRDRHMF